MRMFHFKQSGLGTASALYGGGLRVCVCVFELFVWDLSEILINLVNEHRTAFCVCVFACDCNCCPLRHMRFQLNRDGCCSD